MNRLTNEEELWDGAAVLVVFDEDGTKHLIGQCGIRLSADAQLKLANDLKENALKNYDEIENLRKKERAELEEEWLARVEQPSKEKTKMVYVMQSGNDYKVGVSEDIDRRLREIRRHRPDVEIVAHSEQMPTKKAIEWESKLHEWLSPYNITGEWFCLKPEEANIAISFVSELQRWMETH